MASKAADHPGWLGASGGLSVAGVFLLAFPRRRRKGIALAVLAFSVAAFTALGCGGSTKINPGTTAGTYQVVVTGVGGSGSSQYQTTVSVPITVH
jgi:hypothetical protein